ncbi:MAG: hypothetical protein OXL96_27080 [Candidatus Poribacteria bacterium]|nr:hypothetical protein [Candidatus Poribacteria bacterium]
MFNFRGTSINRVVEKIAELGTSSLVLLLAMGRIEPFLQSRVLNRFSGLAGPLGTFAGFALSAIYRFGSEVLFNRVLEELKKQGKTEEQILEEIDSYPIAEWLKLRVKGYIENVDFETIESADLSNRNQEIFSIIQQSIGEDFEQLESNINEKIDDLESQLGQLESRLNDRINESKAELKRFIGITVAVGNIATIVVVVLIVSLLN